MEKKALILQHRENVADLAIKCREHIAKHLIKRISREELWRCLMSSKIGLKMKLNTHL
jgi:hypothetical protein